MGGARVRGDRGEKTTLWRGGQLLPRSDSTTVLPMRREGLPRGPRNKSNTSQHMSKGFLTPLSRRPVILCSRQVAIEASSRCNSSPYLTKNRNEFITWTLMEMQRLMSEGSFEKSGTKQFDSNIQFPILQYRHPSIHGGSDLSELRFWVRSIAPRITTRRLPINHTAVLPRYESSAERGKLHATSPRCETITSYKFLSSKRFKTQRESIYRGSKFRSKRKSSNNSCVGL